MPELPEVETIRLQLKPRIIGQRIVDADAHPSSKFSSAVQAVNSRIGEVKRLGKYLIIALQPIARQYGLMHGSHQHELIIHLGMTGRLTVGQDISLQHPHLRAWWRLEDNAVFTFHDIRRFGRIHVTRPGDYSSIKTLSQLGPEPLSESFTGHTLWSALKTSRRQLKTQLLSQRPVAGVGNIYADEALWLASINPTVRRLSLERSIKLAAAIKEVLTLGLHNGGTTLRDYVTLEGHSGQNQHNLNCYGRAGEPCLRCSENLRRRVVDARSTTWCHKCQSR